MGNIFRFDSPLMKFMLLITNLICLNILWLICCLPIVTAGSATVALYYTVFQYITKQDDAVLKPFFRTFREQLRPVTPLWLLHLLAGAVMAAECFYLSRGAATWLKILFGVLLFIFMGISSYLYPLIARYDAPPKRALLNSFALSLRHLGSTGCIVILNCAPIALILFAPEYFWKSLLFWMLGGFSLIACLSGKILMPVFQRYDSPAPPHE